MYEAAIKCLKWKAGLFRLQAEEFTRALAHDEGEKASNAARRAFCRDQAEQIKEAIDALKSAEGDE